MIDEEVDFLAECFRRRLHVLERHTVTGAECLAAIQTLPPLPDREPYIADVRGYESHDNRYEMVRIIDGRYRMLPKY